MSTLPVNNIVRSIAAKCLFESCKALLSSAVSFNQGDLIALDTTGHILKAVTATADAANILGVAPMTVVSGKVKSPYQGTAVDSSTSIEDLKGPVFGVIASLILKTGDALNPGDVVYLTTTNAQTVTATDPGDGLHIGIYQGALISSAPAGKKIEVLVGARYGMAGLAV